MNAPSEKRGTPRDPEDDGDASFSTSASNLPTSIDMESMAVGEAATILENVLNYASSLRERTVKGATALADGIRESSGWLVPSAFLNAQSYRIFLGQMLESVTADLGGVRRAITSGRSVQTKHQALARSTVGNLFDMTALSTFHLSPLTVLAIFSDIAYGETHYLQQLSQQLRIGGIVPQDAEISNARALLSAVETAVGNAGDVFSQPPLAAEKLQRTIESMYRALENSDAEQILSRRDIDQLWRQMQLAAEQHKASTWDISATIAVVTLNQIQGRSTLGDEDEPSMVDLFSHPLIDFYWIGLREIERHGLIPTISTASAPYLDSIWKNFAMNHKTWAEQLIGGELIKWGWSQLSWPKLHRS